MKYDVDDLLKSTYHQGEVPTDALNQTVLQMVKECDRMNQNKMETGAVHEQEGKQKKRKYYGSNSRFRKFATVAAVLAMVLLLGSVTVHAAKKFFGINYFWERYGNEMPEKAKELVENNPTVTVKDGEESRNIVDFKVSSVLCDSKYVVVTLDVAVKDADKYFLVTGVADLTDPVSCMSIGIDSKQSIGEYCNENGMQPVQIDAKLNHASEKFADIIMWDEQQTDTGNGTILICAKRMTDDKNFTMGIKTMLRLSKGEEYVASTAGDTLQINVEDKSTEETAYYAVDKNPEYAIPGTSITLKKVKLTTTEVGTYSEIMYRDESTSEDPSVDWLFLCGEHGESLKTNIVASGTCQPEGDNIYLASDCYESMGLPENIYLSVGDSGKVLKLKKCKELD